MSHFYEFGEFRLEPEERRLLRGSETIPLTPKQFDLLQLLLESPGHLLDKEELQQKLWPNAFVEETNLTKGISLLRKTLGDTAEGDRFIETVPKRGYRFVAPVRKVNAASQYSTGDPEGSVATPAFQSGTRISWRVLLLGVALVSSVAVLVLWKGPFERVVHAPASRVVLAVLPFENLSGDAQQDYLSDGLTEEMITQLARLGPERLSVIARTSSMHFKASKKTVAQIGQELGADYVLEGSLRREGQRMRISAQLIQVRDQTHVWAQNYERDVGSLLAVQNDVAQAIARQIEIKLTPQQQARLARSHPRHPEAHELYLRGRYFWNQRSEAGYQRAVGYFQQAVDKQPDYAEAYAGLADSYGLLAALVDAPVPRAAAISQAREAATKALELDDTIAEAHTSLAFVKWQYDWEWSGAEKEFQRAIELNPSYATAHHWYAYLLISLGREEQGLREIRLAQKLDPLSLIINTDLGELLCYAQQYEEAIQQTRKTLEMDPNFFLARQALAWSYARKGMHAESVAEIQTAVATSGNSSSLLMSLAYSYAMAGKRAEARATMAQMKRLYGSVSGFNLAMGVAYGTVGDADRAFASLEKAYQARASYLTLLRVAPLFDPLRSDPRLQDMLRRMGLPATEARK